MSYRNLEIWNLAREMSIAIHKMSLTKLPKFEMYEEGSQIRRSSKSIRSNIVEGYGRRRYKQEFIKYLATESSMSGELYHVKCGKTDALSGVWLTAELNRFRKASAGAQAALGRMPRSSA